jgi:hypothetical protein
METSSVSLSSMFAFESHAGMNTQPMSTMPPAASPAMLPPLAVVSRPVRSHPYSRPRTSKGSGGTSARLSVASTHDSARERSGHIAPETCRHVGMRGTMGEDSMLAEEHGGPDSDIPDELQLILAGQSEDEGALPSPDISSRSLPRLDARVVGHQNARVQFQAEYLDDTEAGGSEGDEVSSRKSFDFTGELGQLKGGSRNSFVEALVTAFKTPPLPTAGEGQLQLNIDSLNDISSMVQQDSPTDTRNDSINSQLNTSFRFDAPPPSQNHARNETKAPHALRYASNESMASIPSVSSLGQMITSSDPFDYETLMRELDEVSSTVEGSAQALERSVARRRLHRLSTDSDRSSVHFRGGRSHRRDDPLSSFTFGAPPVSFHNRPYGRQFGHTQSLSTESGNNGARAARARDRPEQSLDGEDTNQYAARPGLGDKMFQMGAEHGMPLPSIMASPANSDGSTEQQFTHCEYTEQHYSQASDRPYSYMSDRRNSFAPSLTEQHRTSFVSHDSFLEVPGNGRRTSFDADSL